MSSARYYFWSRVMRTHSRDPVLAPEIEIPRGADTKILLHYYKSSGRQSVNGPSASVFNEPELVARTIVLVTLSEYKKLSKRGFYTKFMAEQLSKTGVPGHVQPAVLEQLFSVIDVTNSGKHIIVLLGDVTYFHLSANAANLDEGDVKTTLPLRINGRFTDDQQIIIQMLTTEPRCIIHKVKVVSSIHDLEKVEFDSLDAAVRQTPCAICMEDLDHFDASKQGSELQRLIARLPCLHVYHEDCIVRWLGTDNRSCPLCRSPVVKYHKAPRRLHWPMLMVSAVGLLSMIVPRLLNRS